MELCLSGQQYISDSECGNRPIYAHIRIRRYNFRCLYQYADRKRQRVRIRSNNSDYARLNNNRTAFSRTTQSSSAATFYFGIEYDTNAYIWLDGTNGGLMSLAGSPNESRTVEKGSTFTLPQSWTSPSKYAYKLRGWYDVKNARYYAPGSTVEVTESLVFYADWVAASYDVGRFNASVTDTISTNDFITTHVFDYSTMFNMYSQRADVTVNASGHTETWTLVESGTVPYENGSSLNFIFGDYDKYGEDISYPAGLNAANTNGDVYSGLYNSQLAEMLFGTGNSFNSASGSGVLGKQCLGQADHLFQYGADPADDEHYGYYYYDSRLNAAPYNQSAGRFYVYDYLERTTDSAKDGGGGEYSDFLPFNSPYANTNGKTIQTYTYNGEHGEYPGYNHYMYDAKYDAGGSLPNNVGTNYWFGISSEIEFFLPNKPGSRDSEGNYGNQSIYGEDLTFEFSGDDDVWVLVDGKLVLDIGGVHGIESGSINFSTGDVILNGSVVGSVTNLGSGTHYLTFHYLERGSSQSNCKIRFNISPRYKLTLQKEDVLTQKLLDGAQFSVFTDPGCTVPAQLWTSRDAYHSGQPATNVFTVTDGAASMWGFAAGNTYYIKETRPPDNGYGVANGIIVMTLNNRGTSSYDVIDDPAAQELSPGFTVHGFKVDYETQEAFLVATNGKNIEETTSIQVEKQWADTLNHSTDSVPVYLLADGIRIREVALNEDNDWKYLWSNLPKYREGATTPIVYTVEEGTVPGYVGRIEPITASPPAETAYRITNTPVSAEETISLTVNKAWDIGTLGNTSMYEGLTVQVKLLANGVDTGLTLPLSLRNGWKNTFSDLPKRDSDGKEIAYTVQEVWFSDEWHAEYGDVTLITGSTHSYQTTVTNVCHLTYQLPETGGSGTSLYTTGGLLLLLTAAVLLLYNNKRRKEDRNTPECDSE